MLALDQLSIDHDLAPIGRVREDVLDDVAREDHRGRAIVLGLIRSAMGPDAVIVQVLRERTNGVASRVQAEEFADDRPGLRVLHDLSVHPHVPLRHDAQQVPVALQEAEVVTDSTRDFLAFLLRHDGLDLPRELVHVADESGAVEDQDSALFQCRP